MEKLFTKEGWTVDKRWNSLRAEVFERDMFHAYLSRKASERSDWLKRGSPCVAKFLDPGAGACGGGLTLDHVKCKLMMARKAPDNARHLVTLCAFHHLGQAGGSVWATSHRAVEREYLLSIYGPCEECE
jgi:hypothetical protein